MDPYYFIDGLSIAPNDDNLELHDVIMFTPEGWLLGQDGSPLIVHNGDAYNYITYYNSSKELQFIKNDVVVKTMKLALI
jgi:hypothetical protein